MTWWQVAVTAGLPSLALLLTLINNRSQSKGLQKQIDLLAAQLTSLDNRLTYIQSTFDNRLTRIESTLDNRLNRIEEKIDRLAERVAALADRVPR